MNTATQGHGAEIMLRPEERPPRQANASLTRAVWAEQRRHMVHKGLGAVHR
eukprot:CAMPEP_0198524300 /NCGR_PEP_ID=MMETSP1462-20131121/22668_1 /TAXON_ID=1333877 /ORGANISM="Brandtodinium nutriculum, Strain RCC3387" /LENGTH=50 /DNA_ID=CAMNT_0044254023 /DNA_START=253 /DNA_END=402 /DNA_ORIENTATION=+